MRRRNHFAKDLWTPEFRPRRIDNKNDEDNSDWKGELFDQVEEYYEGQCGEYVQEPGDDD